MFGPVWTTLYILMAVAAWRVWRPGGFRAAPIALTFFVAQLLLNGAWSYLFFGRRDIGGALVEIVLLWVAILATLLAFWRRDRIAGGLLIPYLAWVTLATALNFEIWRMNA
jgi:tryptophan-rich sensory protein